MLKTSAKESALNTLSTTNPETELMLCCCRTKLNDRTIQTINTLLDQKLDWEYLIKIAAKQGVLPLIYYNLNQTAGDRIPQEILSRLRRYFQVNAQRNLCLTAELIRILKALASNSIDAITFKGPTLAVTAYGELALRQFCDLDILIPEQHASQIVDVFVSLGYRLPDPIGQLEKRPYMAYQEFLESEETQKKYNFFHPQKKITIDLQWSLTERRIGRFFPVDFQHLNTNPARVTLAGTDIKQFSPEDMLLYLCFHGSKHCWEELKWICDVAEFIQSNPRIDWQLVSSQAQAWKVERMFSLGLFLVEDVLKIELLEAARQNIQVDGEIVNLAAKVKQGIFEHPLTETEKITFRFKLRKQLSEQVFYIADILFTPTAKEWGLLPFALPKSISFLYRILRPYRLIKEYLTN